MLQPIWSQRVGHDLATEQHMVSLQTTSSYGVSIRRQGKAGPEALGTNDTFEQTEINSNVWEGAVLSLAGPVL